MSSTKRQTKRHKYVAEFSQNVDTHSTKVISVKKWRPTHTHIEELNQKLCISACARTQSAPRTRSLRSQTAWDQSHHFRRVWPVLLRRRAESSAQSVVGSGTVTCWALGGIAVGPDRPVERDSCTETDVSAKIVSSASHHQHSK